jgi:CRP/FNR family cyclic AMP-dependent transcriptional regulator
MNEPVTPELLKALAFLVPATEDELRQLVPVTRIAHHPAGTVLFREGDHLSHVFIVTTGTVALEINGRDHRPRRFQTVGPGELLGWSPLLGSGPMTAAARALADVQVVAIDAKAVLDLCDEDPKFGFQFMRRTAAAIAARLSATRLQLLDVYKHELPATPEGGEL